MLTEELSMVIMMKILVSPLLTYHYSTCS